MGKFRGVAEGKKVEKSPESSKLCKEGHQLGTKCVSAYHKKFRDRFRGGKGVRGG